MKRAISFGLVAVLAVSLAGCSDSWSARLSARLNDHKITLYSGGQPLKSWISTDVPDSGGEIEGCSFRDKVTGKHVQISGTFIVEQQ